MQRSKSNSPGLKTGVKRDFFFHFRIIRDWGQETIKWGERSRVEGILSKSNEVMVASVATFPKDFAVSVTVSLFLWIWLPGLCGYEPERAPPGTLQSPFLQSQDVQHPCVKTQTCKMGFISPVIWCVSCRRSPGSWLCLTPCIISGEQQELTRHNWAQLSVNFYLMPKVSVSLWLKTAS